ncbi:AAA family ATPase [Nocardioides sp. CFH 31398]|uniref:AAA family ATPase n=1 Tax=Nocardioides sp. CFH 31398 TaxID=2919579 RepID=UPI001F06E773|nr:AAA family ATPase [Nocardioides sp. CFH 31398]MCH1866951.1 nucleoside kinase [Nocardioides sp. CFH 31398]
MGERNYLVEGVSGTGKTSVCHALRARGFHAVNGDRELAHRGDPVTGGPTAAARHWHHLWSVDRLRAMVADATEPVSFFCGGSRNHPTFLDLFDAVVVLQVDVGTLTSRLAARGDDEFGGSEDERDLVLRLHRTGEDTPPADLVVDATAPLEEVVDRILDGLGLPATATR